MKRQLYARISGSISEYCQWQSLRMLPSLSLLDLRTAFPYFVVKLKTVGSMEHFEEKFRLKESFELCRNMGKNLFVAESYLIDDARREGGTRDGSKWDLRTLWMERPSKERNISWVSGSAENLSGKSLTKGSAL